MFHSSSDQVYGAVQQVFPRFIRVILPKDQVCGAVHFGLTKSALCLQYFDAGHGSSMEKHKVKREELVKDFQRFEGDTGCTEVQGTLKP